LVAADSLCARDFLKALFFQGWSVVGKAAGMKAFWAGTAVLGWWRSDFVALYMSNCCCDECWVWSVATSVLLPRLLLRLLLLLRSLLLLRLLRLSLGRVWTDSKSKATDCERDIVKI
jgi:hypothetical protein